MDELEQMGNSSCTPLRPVITARLYREGKCFGPGVAMLLRRVRTLRSLRAAAMDMDMPTPRPGPFCATPRGSWGSSSSSPGPEAATAAAPH